MLEQHFLAQCESEALHRSGAIQPHGTLLVVDPSGTVSHVAANIQAFLGHSPETWLGQPLPAEFHQATVALEERPGSRQSCILAVTGSSRPLDVVVSRGTIGQLIVEVTKRWDESPPEERPKVLIMERVPDDEGEMQAAREKLTERIADLTGFQRVMYYQFRDDGDGEVIAEARRSDVYGSYLDLRYPASDIPQIARTLYLKNPWRLIPDINAIPVPLLSEIAIPPDLTYSDLRSVSPVHLSYLTNMNVGASLSFPIAQGGELVALLAAHHQTPCQLPLRTLEQGSALVRNHVLTLQRYHAQVIIKTVDQPVRRFQALRPLFATMEEMVANWDKLAFWLMEQFRVDGVQLCLGTNLHRKTGKGGKEETLITLEHWFLDNRESTVKQTDSLSRQTGKDVDDQIAGALALRVGTPKGEIRLYLTRQEYFHEVAWSGNPHKPTERSEGSDAISPRRSFDKWIEKRKGYCRSWTRIDRLLALSLRQFLNGVFNS